jgi:ParB family transcriptional regulator, chromosome partitioning protein
MSGIKSAREKSRGMLDNVEARLARGEAPQGKPYPEDPLQAKTSPGRMFGLQDKIFQAEERARLAEEELESLKASTGNSEALQIAEDQVLLTEIALREAEVALQDAMKNQPIRAAYLADLYEIPGRRRKLSPQQYAELKANLEHNKLTNPVTVRTRPAGGYEVIAGHNRIAVYRDLDRDQIDINILDLDDDEVDRAAFYSNLLSPSLPDYEKFTGFKARMVKKGLTQSELAAEAGVTQPYISTLMSFGDLPAEALEYVAQAPELFGTRVVPKFVKLAKQGKQGAVVEACKKIATEGVAQAVALKHAEGKVTPVALRAQPITVRRGKSTYCEILHSDKTVRLSFSSSEEAEATLSAIKSVLEDRVKALK